ncbi:alpha-glucosidase/alpha-galactosidase [Chloroflexia bacterium SDU3-3]|nr:alpha-glucosidase/alpha-galactosidase [Chloroflexia bacterium SDU3-3]
MSSGPKITFIGAGSVVFTKNLLGDILTFPELAGCTISLYDIDPERLETAEQMARWTAQTLGASPTIEAHLDRREALRGASYAINMIQVGGHAATLLDFDIPRKYGLRQTIGDSHGIGGIFRALRTIPVMREIARDMEEVCPGAIMLNYTNPMSMLCWAWFASSRIPIVGLCHSVQYTTEQISGYAGVPYDEVTYLGAGINHVAWILRFEHKGRDIYPLLRKALEDGRIPQDDLVRAELFRRLGYYVTESSEHNAEYSAHFIPHPGQIEKFNVPIDEYIRRSEENLQEFADIRAQLQRGEPFEIERSAEYGSLIIHSMETGQPRVIYGNVRNDNLITNLPTGCCVEVPCLVDKNGVQPTHIGDLPPQLAGMSRQHVAVQELTARAALQGSREHVYHAAMLDPLAAATMPLDQIWAMVDELIAAHGDALPEGIRS